MVLTLIGATSPRARDESKQHQLMTRAVGDADIVDLGKLYFAAYDPGVACASLAEATEDIEASFAGEYGTLLYDASRVAVHSGGRIVASVLTVQRAPWPDVPDTPFIIEVFTDRRFRRMGLARGLVIESMAVLRSSGHELVALRVAETNTAALALYAQLGFGEWHDTPSVARISANG
jgi:ribosomal protein S18 acetylase RimI-like enzyme